MNKSAYYFIKVTQDHWTAKNKLGVLLKSKIQNIDMSLAFDYKSAKKIIKQAFDDAHTECKSRCKPVQWNEYSYRKGQWSFQFSGIIHVTIYKAKNIIE